MPSLVPAVPPAHDAIFRLYRYTPQLAARRCLASFKTWAKQARKLVGNTPLMQVQERLARSLGYPSYHAWRTTMERLAHGGLSGEVNARVMAGCFAAQAPLLVQLAPGVPVGPDERHLLASAADTLSLAFDVDIGIAELIVAHANGRTCFDDLSNGQQGLDACRLEVDEIGVGRFVISERYAVQIDGFKSRWNDPAATVRQLADLLKDVEVFLEAVPDCVLGWYLASEIRAKLTDDLGLPAKRVAVDLQMRMARLAQPKLKSLPFKDNEQFYAAARDVVFDRAHSLDELRDAADLAAGLLLYDEHDHIGMRYLAAATRSALDDHAKAYWFIEEKMNIFDCNWDGRDLFTRGMVRLNALPSDEETTEVHAELFEAAMLLPGLRALVLDGVIGGNRARNGRRPAPELYDIEELLYVFDTYQPEASLSLRQLYGQEEFERIIDELETPGRLPSREEIREAAKRLARQPMALVTPDSGSSVRPRF